MVSLPPISPTQRSFSTYSSSPPRSSSPPMTPFSTRSSFSQAHIRSSPEIDYDYPSRHYSSSYDEPISSLDRFLAHNFTKLPNTNLALPSLKSIMAEDTPFDTLPPVKIPPLASSQDIPMARTFSSVSEPYSTDESILSEDDGSQPQDDDDDGFSFAEADLRTTVFQMSEERGRWQYEPIPFKLDPRSTRSRQSAPTQSALKVAPLPSRPASEPAPSTARNLTPVSGSGLHAHISSPLEQEPLSPLMNDAHLLLPHSDGCDSLPSLMSDAESMDREESHCPLSPLPPSSPPMSLYSLPSSPVLRASSPLSVPPLSPLLAPIDYVPGSEEGQSEDVSWLSSAQSAHTPPSVHAAARIPAAKTESIFTPKVVSHAAPISSATSSPNNNSAAHSSTGSSSFRLSISDDDVPMSPLTRGSTSLNVGLNDMHPDSGHLDLPHAENPDNIDVKDSNSVDPMGSIKTQDARSSASASSSLKRLNRSLSPPNGPPHAHGKGTEKRKTDEELEEGPVKKKAKSKTASKQDSQVPRKPGRTFPFSDDEEPEHTQPKSKKKLKNASATNNDAASSSKSKSKSTSSRSKSGKRSAAEPTSPKTKRPLIPSPDEALDAEICGMLIESLATSRASSIPATKLLTSVVQARPSLKEQKSESEWMEVVQRVLFNGESIRGSGMFGKVESSFKDDSDRSLEAQWFYVPELDPDQDRATLVKTMMPRAGKRATTKQYKQYYYAPLGKISRWDPEDEI